MISLKHFRSFSLCSRDVFLSLAMFIGLCLSTFATTDAMVYRPQRTSLWDVWMLYHNGEYHVYYGAAGKGENGVGHAVSKDGVHWTETELAVDRTGKWMGSGYVWRSPNFATDGKFQCNMSCFPPQGGLGICFAESTQGPGTGWKVVHSQPGVEKIFTVDKRWYTAQGPQMRWDCIAVMPPVNGKLYGYWSAKPKDGSYGFGFGESTDGINWKALPPPKVDWGKFSGSKPSHCELGDVQKASNGKYYALLNHSLKNGAGSRMIQLIADKPEGPFVAAQKNAGIMEGDVHFARFLNAPDGLLIIQHVMTKEPGHGKWGTYNAPIKKAVVDEEGIMRAGYWKGNENIKGEKAVLKSWKKINDQLTIQEVTLDGTQGFVLEGTIDMPQKDTPEKDWPGLFLGCAEGPEHAKRDTVIRVTPEGTSLIGTVKEDGSDFQPRDPRAMWFGPAEIDREMSFGKTAQYRLLMRHGMLEFYLDDILFHVRTLQKFANGKIGIVGAPNTVRDVQAWQMSFPKK